MCEPARGELLGRRLVGEDGPQGLVEIVRGLAADRLPGPGCFLPGRVATAWTSALAPGGLAVPTSVARRGRDLRGTAVPLCTAATLALGVVALALLNRKL